MNTFCTIITGDHLAFARTLHFSLRRYRPDTHLHVLVVDTPLPPGEQMLTFLDPDSLSGSEFFEDIESRYARSNTDYYRWALKPVLMGYLLEKGFQNVIFTDPDIYFVNPFDFLFDLLNQEDMVLTPHWANTNFRQDPDSIRSVLKEGLFNAGFVATTQGGLPAIRLWAGLCRNQMDKREDTGVYDDQKYLDLLPVHFEKVHILRHRGCNLANWNIQSCRREMVNGNLMINGQYEPVFIHFTNGTIRHILNQNDPLLRPYLDEYIRILGENGFDLLSKMENLNPDRYASLPYRVKHKLRLRTRIKQFLFKLAEKL